MSENDLANQLPVPGEEHELLKPFEGTFDAKVTIFAGPGETMESTGTIVSRFVVNGLYLEQDYQGDPVEGPYQPFSGKGFWGYNFHTKKYEGFWVDNASSIMQREDGEVDETGKVWVMQSEFDHPQGGTLIKRSVIRMIDNDHNEVEAFLTLPGGEEMKSMAISYTRKSS